MKATIGKDYFGKTYVVPEKKIYLFKNLDPDNEILVDRYIERQCFPYLGDADNGEVVQIMSTWQHNDGSCWTSCTWEEAKALSNQKTKTRLIFEKVETLKHSMVDPFVYYVPSLRGQQ